MGNHHAKRQKAKLSAWVYLLPIILVLLVVGTTLMINQNNKTKRSEEIAYQMELIEIAKAERIEAERVEAARIAEEARLAKIEAERIEAERIEAERIEAERIAKEKIEAEKRKAAADAAKAAEAARAAERAAAKKAAAAAEAALAAEEKARLAAEKTERARISSALKQQAASLQLEQAEFNALMPTPTTLLDVYPLQQNPDLPNGCEATALATLMMYSGMYVSHTTLADSFLPQIPFKDVNKQRIGGDPDQVYCGNPRFRSGGYYCFINPLMNTSTAFLNSVGETTLKPVDLTGADEQTIISRIDSGEPVLAFTTLSMGEAFKFAPSKWIVESTGETHIPYLNLHCVVVHGYDDEFFYIADPLKGTIQCKRSTFMSSFSGMGSKAMTLSVN